MLDLIHLKNRLHPGPLPADTIAALALALYDLDAFRTRLAEGSIPEAEPLRVAFPHAAADDDLQLLQAGLAWSKRILER